MKLPKYIFGGTLVYLVAFLIDYVTTLFAIDESGNYHSKLGLKISMEMNAEEMYTVFSLTPQILLTYIIWISFVCLVLFIIKKKLQKKPSI